MVFTALELAEIMPDASKIESDEPEIESSLHYQFRTPEYFWFDAEDLELAGFRLICQAYQPIVANESGKLWSDVLELYLGIHDGKLRYFSQDGELIPTPEEAALQSQQRADRLADQLRALGIEPE